MERPARRSRSQALSAQNQIRELILAGRLRPGERVSELGMVEELGVSRTPVRIALARLEEEGLLETIPSGGFAVKAFSERDVVEAIEIRGIIEGYAARLAAERGVASEELAPVERCLDEIDSLLDRPKVTATTFAEYIELNSRFHQLVTSLAASDIVARQVERASALPFASPGAIVAVPNERDGGRRVLFVAQDQHRRIVESIIQRDGGRAEMIMREHSRISSRAVALVIQSHPMLRLIPASQAEARGSRTRRGASSPR